MLKLKYNAAAVKAAIEAGPAGCGCIFFFAFFFISPIIGALTMPYAVNTWLEYLGKDPTFTWYYGLFLGIIPSVGYWSLIVAIITFIAIFFIG